MGQITELVSMLGSHMDQLSVECSKIYTGRRDHRNLPADVSSGWKCRSDDPGT